MQFKEGDRIIYIGGHDRFVTPEFIDKTGEVISINTKTDVSVLFDNGIRHGCYPENLRHIKQHYLKKYAKVLATLTPTD